MSLDILAEVVRLRTYAAKLPDGTKETHTQTVDRCKNMHIKKFPKLEAEINDAFKFVYEKKVVPSMRSLQFSGGAIERVNEKLYNCTALAITEFRDFADALYLLSCGCGVGYSVQHRHVSQLPKISRGVRNIHVIEDTKEAWADSLLALMKNPETEFNYDAIRPHGAPLSSGGTACLTGDTILFKDRKKSKERNSITIAELFRLKMKKPHLFQKVKVRSLNESNGSFYRNQVLDVIDSGIAKVYEIVTKMGYKIKATENHRFMREDGSYDYVRNFKILDLIAVNGVPRKKTGVCKDCKAVISNTALRCVSCYNLSQLREDALHTTARQRKQNKEYRKLNCEACEVPTPRPEVHHIDHDPYNNDHENLMSMCSSCHQNLHVSERALGDPQTQTYVHYDEVTSIKYVGEEQVFDICMEAPDHNFVANGFVSHNSGAECLQECHEQVYKILRKAVGRQLLPYEVSDIICHIANCIVSGGVRRSALICLFDADNVDMLEYKSGKWWESNPQRGKANVSAVLHRKDLEFNTKFNRIMDNCFASNSGEPGVFLTNDFDMLTNPCVEIALRDKQMCVSADTPIITQDGCYPIATLVGKSVKVWNGEKWSEVSPVKTGENRRLLRVKFSDGSYLDCTENHNFSVKHRFQKEFSKVQASDLSKGPYSLSTESFQMPCDKTGVSVRNAYTLGVLVGDGGVTGYSATVDLFGKKMSLPVAGERSEQRRKVGYSVDHVTVVCTGHVDIELLRRLKYGDFSSFDEIFQWDAKSILEFFAGLADADGSQANKGIRIYITSEERARTSQLLLTRLGIRSSVNIGSEKGTITNFGTRKEDLYYLQITYCPTLPCVRLNTKDSKKASFKGKNQNIVSVRELPGLHDTYCFEEKDKHKAVFNNTLTYQCNLTEVNVALLKTPKELFQAVIAATVIGTIQASYTNFTYINPKFKANCEAEALLGVSFTGQAENWELLSEDNLRDCAYLAKSANEIIAKMIGINPAARIGCTKPSGSTSAVLSTTSGIHAAFAPFYLRRVRILKADPIARFLAKKVPDLIEDDLFDNYSTIFTVPVNKSGAIQRGTETAIEILERMKHINKNWIHTSHRSGDNRHNVSLTVNYHPHEIVDIKAWMLENSDIYSGISLLPFDGGSYVQKPFEEITEEEYVKWCEKLPADLDLSAINYGEQIDERQGEIACGGGGSCEIR